MCVVYDTLKMDYWIRMMLCQGKELYWHTLFLHSDCDACYYSVGQAFGGLMNPFTSDRSIILALEFSDAHL